MNYTLKRTYYNDGTTGDFLLGEYLICHTIELPNLNNQHQISCIPEGIYRLVKHHSEHLGDIVLLENVPNRDLIYIHPANDASDQLKGCIAPVYELTGHDSGTTSRACFNAIKAHIYAAIDRGEEVTLKITS